jgi:hypothetical protein
VKNCVFRLCFSINLSCRQTEFLSFLYPNKLSVKNSAGERVCRR